MYIHSGIFSLKRVSPAICDMDKFGGHYETSVSSLVSVKNFCCCIYFFDWVLRISIYSGCKSFTRYMIYKYLFPVGDLPCHSNCLVIFKYFFYIYQDFEESFWRVECFYFGGVHVFLFPELDISCLV